VLNAQRRDLLDDSDHLQRSQVDEMIQMLENYLDRLNNKQGLGFSAYGAVLDKKRHRVIMSAVAGVFAKIVPFLLAIYSVSNNAAPFYWRLDNSTRIFAYPVVSRNYADSAAFCESLWKDVASVHIGTEGQNISRRPQVQGRDGLR